MAGTPQSWRDNALGLMPAAGMLGSIAYVSTWKGDPFGTLAALLSAGGHPLIMFGTLQAGFFLIQTLLCLRYREVFATPNDAPLPRLTVVVPAYNEGAMVRQSIASVAASDYPKNLLQMIVVDDGSQDDTYAHMVHMQQMHPQLVHLLRLPKNGGKRAALYAGFQASHSEVLVTLDSDSALAPHALRQLVAPLQCHPSIGAVAGRVAVLNRDTLLGSMLDVQYSLAFDFLRAAQSVYGVVTCCPGALTAMRSHLVMPHLDTWLNQTFLGRPVAHGEDQALTNIILTQGYDTCYQRSAIVHTLVPQTYRNLCKMLTRWDRSYIVESVVFARSLTASLLRRGRWLAVTNFWFEHARRIMLYVGLAELPWLVVNRPALLQSFVVAFLIAATSSALYHLRSEYSLRFLYGVLYAIYGFFYLNWILPWALLTVHDRRWGTR